MMDNKTADAEYYSKAARLIHTVRYVVLLILLLFVAIGFTAFKRELTYENFRYIMRYVNFNLSSTYLDTNELSYISDEDSIYGYLKGDLAMLSSKGFRTYDFSGSELMYEKISLPNPCLETAGKYALCYDVSGTELELYNSFSHIVSKKFDYGIKDACVRSDGSYAVSTSGKHLRSKVVVYEEDGEFSYETRDKEVVAVSLPEDSSNINFIALTVENGEFKFILMSYNTRSEDSVVEREFTGEYPLRLISTKDMMCILTDKALHFVDYSGKTVARYSHVSDKLSGVFASGDYIALTYTRNVAGTGTVRIFNVDGTEIESCSFNNSIISFSAYDDKIYALEKGMLTIMETDKTGKHIKEDSVKKTEVDRTFAAVFATASDEYVLVSNLGARQISG